MGDEDRSATEPNPFLGATRRGDFSDRALLLHQL
jgi:hypothetical protein